MYIRALILTLCQQRRVRSSLVTYAKKLPVDASNGGSYNLQTLVADLIAEAKSNLSSNTKVIPVLQALNSLLEADALERLCDSEDGIKRRDEVSLPHCKQSDVWRSARALLSISSRGVSRLKSVQRIQECMKAYVQCIAHVCMIVTEHLFQCGQSLGSPSNFRFLHSTTGRLPYPPVPHGEINHFLRDAG